jgi:hypothetical protein
MEVPGQSLASTLTAIPYQAFAAMAMQRKAAHFTRIIIDPLIISGYY